MSDTSAGNASAVRRQYAGCQVGTTRRTLEPARPLVGCFAGPIRVFVMARVSSTRAAAAVPPSATTSVTPEARSSSRSLGRHAAIAALGGGTLALPRGAGGRQRHTLVNNTSLRGYPWCCSTWSRSCPEGPTKGRPFARSYPPGASPTTASRALFGISLGTNESASNSGHVSHFASGCFLCISGSCIGCICPP